MPWDGASSAEVIRPQRLAVLDALRLGAALAVLMFHYSARPSSAWGTSVDVVFPTLSDFTRYGYLGVDLFFMISGFVILMTAWGRSPSHFIASRISRIFPAYWCAVLATGTLLLIAGKTLGKGVTVQQVLVNLTMAQKALGFNHVDGVYWTLWVEFRFYFLIGLFMLVGITRSRVMIVASVWPLLAAIAESSDNELFENILVSAWAPYFALGMLLYLGFREGWSKFLGLLCAFQLLLAMGQAARYTAKMQELVGSEVKPLFACLAVTLCAALVLIATSRAASDVRAPILTLLGALTYPLYLIHEYWGWLLISHMRGMLGNHGALAIATLTMLLIAYLVHRLVEKPIGPRLRRICLDGMAIAQQSDGTAGPSLAPEARCITDSAHPRSSRQPDGEVPS